MVEHMISRDQPESQAFRTLGAVGTPIMVGGGDRVAKVREVMEDLQMAIDGYISQTGGVSPVPEDEATFRQTFDRLGVFARSCSIFLRKLVLGETGRKGTRLLDDDLCRNADLGFPRIRRIDSDRRVLSIASMESVGGTVQLTLEGTDFPASFAKSLTVQPTKFDVSVEWPLPGMATWTEQPTIEKQWQIGPDELFDPRSPAELSCDNWLGQQLVLVNGRGVSLGEMMRVMANTEGAHSAVSIPLWRWEAGKGGRAQKDAHIHVVDQIVIAGINYNHIVVMEAALHLYIQLLRCEHITGQRIQAPTSIQIPGISFALDVPVFSRPESWLGFSGSILLSYGPGQRVESYVIKAPAPR